MKKTTHDHTLPVEQQHYKKKYLLRKLEEKEATEEIREQVQLYEEDYCESCVGCASGFCFLHGKL